jgi:hypothetical protein
MAAPFTARSLAFLADTASALANAPASLDEGGAGAALLHAALYPLATQAQLLGSIGAQAFPGAAGAGAAPPPSPSAATAALLQCLGSPCASSESVTLALVGLCLCWGCCRSAGSAGAVCEGIAAALAPPPAAAGGQGEGEAGSSALPAALSSGFLGLLNALCTSRATGEEQACLDVALQEPLATLPLRAARLTGCATGLLAAALRHCAGAGAAAAAAAAAAAEAAEAAAEAADAAAPAQPLPSPLLARAAAGPRLLYASDARVAVDIALRAASDVQGGEAVQGWLGALRALQQHCCPEYRRVEVEGALGEL